MVLSCEVLAAPVLWDARKTPFDPVGRPPWGPHSCGVPRPLPSTGAPVERGGGAEGVFN